MCRKYAFTVLAFLIALPAFAEFRDSEGPPGRASAGLRRHRDGEVLVKFAGNVSATAVSDSAIKAAGGKKLRNLGSSGWVHVKTREGQSVESAIEEFHSFDEVEAAQPNFRYTTTGTPNDPQFASLWSARNTGQSVSGATYAINNPGVAGNDLGLEGAWGLITDCGSVTVAVVDTGVNYTHTELSGNMWNGGTAYPKHGYDFVDDNEDPLDLNGHGTHVAGIIGGAGNNGTGVVGICWKARIMAVRVMNAAGEGLTSDIILGIDFAVANGAKVINMSLGQGQYDAALDSAVAQASSQGVILVVAAGNDGANNDSGSTPTYPCNYQQPNLICVAALDQAYQLASFSNYGATSVAVGAPGTNINSVWAGVSGTITDTFNTVGSLNWTTNNASWDYGTRALSGGTYNMLMSPGIWDRSTAKYTNNMDGRIRKAFNLATYSAAVLSFSSLIDTQASHDYFRIGYHAAGGDPFAGGSVLETLSGTTNASAISLGYDLGDCRTSSCNVGFQLTSDASTVSYGVSIYNFKIKTLTVNSSSYKILNGTSMATPQVAGLAAMIMAYNPSYTAADVVRAIVSGGVPAAALSGKTTTGKAVHAVGALTYIAPPSGVSALVQ